MEERHSDVVSEIQRERVLPETVLPGLCDFTYSVPNPVKPQSLDESVIRCYEWLGHLGDCECEQKLTTECIENVIMMVPFSSVAMWTFGEKIGNGWKKILWQSGKIAFIFSVSIEILQLLLRLGTFQLSDNFYNTVGGVLGGLMYCAVMKVRKRL